MLYQYLLAFHLLSIIIWVSSLFYLQRIFVFSEHNKIINEGFFIYKKIASPAFLATIVFGIILISLNKSLLSTGFWIYVKFFFISLIIILHHLAKIKLNKLKNGQKEDKKIVFYHSLAPFILVAFVVILTLTKSF